MNTDEIKDIFLSLRFLRAEQLLLKKKVEENPHAEDILKKLGFVSNQIQRAELWMKLLSDDEAYLLIEGKYRIVKVINNVGIINKIICN